MKNSRWYETCYVRLWIKLHVQTCIESRLPEYGVVDGIPYDYHGEYLSGWIPTIGAWGVTEGLLGRTVE